MAVQFLEREINQYLYPSTSPDTKKEENNNNLPGLPLAEATRCMCLSIVLYSQLGYNAQHWIYRDRLAVITNEINKQWLESKARPDDVRPSETLNDALRHFLPDDVANPEYMTPEDALGLIMPQYETLWRVVLLTYVTAYYRNDFQEEMYVKAYGVPACLGDGVREREAVKIAKVRFSLEQFGLPDHKKNADTYHVLQEGLRLYPSNNSIYRAPPGADSEAHPPYKADIQLCHRDPEIWGSDALLFRPDRFDNLTPLQKRSYFPFSIGTHQCPAISGFGNRMVAMLVIAMGRTLSLDLGQVIFEDPSLEMDLTTPLPTGRDDMETWRWRKGKW